MIFLMHIDYTMIGWAVACAVCLGSIALIYRFRSFFDSKTGLTDGPIARGIIRFTIPLLIGNIFQQFYNMVDAMILGKYAGKAALAAVGPSGFVYMLIISLVIGVSMGAGILVAQAYGGKQFDRLRKIVDTSYLFCLVAGVTLMVVGYFVSEPILRLLNTPADVMDGAVAYLRIMFYGVIFLFGFNFVSGILRGVGDSVTPLMFLILSAAINIILDLVFVAGLHWGVAGAAWATIIAQAISCVCSLAFTRRLGRDYLRFRVKGIRFDWGLFKRTMAIGVPSGLQMVFVSLSLLVLNGLVNKYGSDATAAWSAAGRLDSFIGFPGINFGIALSTFVGQNLGAGRMHRISKGMAATLLMSIAFTVAVDAILIPFRYQLLGLFLDAKETAALDYGASYFWIVAWFYPFLTSLMVISGAIRGAGKGVFALVGSFVPLILIRLPLGYLFQAKWELNGVWAAFPVSWAIGFVISLVYWISGRWKKGFHPVKPIEEAIPIVE